MLWAKSNPAAYTVGKPADYALLVTNNGSADAREATVADALPAGVQFNSAANALCAVSSGSPETGQLVMCLLAAPITANGGTASFTINVTPLAASGGTSVANHADVDTTGGSTPIHDPNACTDNGTPDAGCAVTPPLLVTPAPAPSPSDSPSSASVPAPSPSPSDSPSPSPFPAPSDSPFPAPSDTPSGPLAETGAPGLPLLLAGMAGLLISGALLTRLAARRRRT